MRFALRSRFARTLALALVLALMAPATPAFAADPTDPASAPALSPSPATGTVSGTEPYYYQYVDVAAGQYLSLDLSCDTEYYPLDLALYAGQTNDPFAEVAVSAGSGPDESISWLVPEGAGGRYTIEIKTTLGVPEATWQLDWTLGAAQAPRLWGSDRYETSYATSRSTFATATTVVVASGAAFPDALAASGLAGMVDAPVLLTKPTTIPAGLVREIVRLGAQKVYVVGGTSAVSADVFTQLQATGSVTEAVRLSGRDRYETAKKVAEEIWVLSGRPLDMDNAFVVRGDDFADALAVSPLAYNEGIPVLLTRSGVLSGYTSSFLSTYKIQDVWVAGGEAAVSDEVFQDLAGIVQDDVVRWAGSDRYATAATVAEQGAANGFVPGWQSVGLATGVSFPDALSGGASAGMYGGPLLLTKGTVLSPACAAALDAHAAQVARLLVFGGEAAIQQSVVDEALAVLD